MKILHVVGARPNFMKVAPVMAALKVHGRATQVLVHTGQHYDRNMSQVFFERLGLPEPDINLDVGLGSHTEQTAHIMMRFEKVLLEQRPDLVVVYGDVNSTLAAALVCKKMCLRLAHVEAGLRSLDRAMPEEINRLVTDQIADLLFTPSADGDDNLKREGVDSRKIHFVGNVMIDTMVGLLPKVINDVSTIAPCSGKYALMTMHRPSNVDDAKTFKRLMNEIVDVAKSVPVIYPVHPRARKSLSRVANELSELGVHLIDPQGYLEFLSLQRGATFVITDSGGVQEETTYLGIPCLTIRENTERPITVKMGTNIVVGRDYRRMHREIESILAGNGKSGTVPPLWDGKAGERIAEIIAKH